MSVQHDKILPPRFAASESTPTILVDNIENKIDGKYDNGWEQDPANPRNWSLNKKWIATSIVSYIFWEVTGRSSNLLISFFHPRLRCILLSLHWEVL